MSFGRPPSFSDFSVNPPDRGSFPLDHFAECKNQMMTYLNCLRQQGQNSAPCRILVKDYLECRMSKGLMERDEWRNLGMENLPPVSSQEATSSSSSESDVPSNKPHATNKASS
ncbi:hypothetical protein SCHPADRAFT_816202 [Schizopora paradoxa]|uniref:CHCH domain-containing protein n=1 Tax=Schizopora paradoxa TaxID=27342 RepID=A0A0H2S871_9AGAM|nr:hypothetical protein SCHPADRAFT_816202 [Schizopora paradoxa]